MSPHSYEPIKDLAEFVSLLRPYRHENNRRVAHAPISDELLLAISQHEDEGIRLAGAHNKTVDGERLLVFVNDTSSRVLAEAASRHSAGPVVLARLANSQETTVRLAVVRNRKCPVELLKQFDSDPCDYVREEAAEKLAALASRDRDI